MGLEADKALLGQGLVVFAHIHAHTTVMKSFLAFKIMIHCRYTYVSSFAAVIKNKIRFKKNQIFESSRLSTADCCAEHKTITNVAYKLQKSKVRNYDKKEASSIFQT